MVSVLYYCAYFRVKKNNASSFTKDVEPKNAYQIILSNKENPGFVIIDVRTPDEYQSFHIEGATNINFYSKDFQKILSTLPKDKTYLIYCRSGHRSGITKEIMENLGFTKIYNLKGGINSWVKEELPTVSGN